MKDSESLEKLFPSYLSPSVTGKVRSYIFFKIFISYVSYVNVEHEEKISLAVNTVCRWHLFVHDSRQ